MHKEKEWFKKLIADFVKCSPENRFTSGEPIWDAPLVGFAAGDDPFFEFFQEDIGDFYLSPLEMFNGQYTDNISDAKELTVISWILPQTKATREENAHMDRYPGEKWSKGRVYGEQFNRTLAGHVVEELRQQGYEAVAPMLSPLFALKTSEKYGYASTWSERHTAFVAGLGTFGLCDGLITPVGKAMRCGSVIIKAALEPSEREYTTHTEYCLYYSDGQCFECAKRCPVGAIGVDGHDKSLCREYQRTVLSPYIKEHYAVEASCCGLCQTGVPCESGIPKKD